MSAARTIAVAVALTLTVFLIVAVVAIDGTNDPSALTGFAAPARAATTDPLVIAAGDMVPGSFCSPTSLTQTTCQDRAASDLALNASAAAVLALGDLQYENGELAKFQRADLFGRSW